MKNLENVATVTAYPTNLVGWGYSLTGGATGGLLVGLLFIVDIQHIAAYIFIIIISTICGSVLGFIPAAITGVYLAKSQVTLSAFKDCKKVFKIGFLVSSVYTLLAIMIFSISSFPYSAALALEDILSNLLMLLLLVLAMGLLGGISSLIVGKLVLPKVVPKMLSQQLTTENDLTN